MFIAEENNDSLKYDNNFSWSFNEETPIFFQLIKNKFGKTAEDYAKAYGWDTLAELLNNKSATVH